MDLNYVEADTLFYHLIRPIGETLNGNGESGLEARLDANYGEKDLVLDLSSVRHLTTAALRALVDTERRLNRSGGMLRLIIPIGNPIYGIIENAGFTSIFRMYANRESLDANYM